MQSTHCKLCFLVAVLSLATFSRAQSAEKNLGDVLRESRWDRIVGTWVDEATKGEAAKTTYAWKYKNHVIAIDTKSPANDSTGLMGRNPDSGEVFHMGADNQGGSSIGKWNFTKEEAVLEIAFVSGEGQQGGLKITHVLKDDDTLLVTIEAGEPITFTMIRQKK